MATITNKVPYTTTRRRSQRATPMDLYQAIADTAGALHKYQDIPRLRFQAVLAFMMFVLAIGGLVGMNLFMESRIGLVGREILSLNSAIRYNRLLNEDLQSQISTVLSNTTLRQRALQMGFEDANLEEIQYVAVPGFGGNSDVDLSNPQRVIASAPLRAEYTESLLHWLSNAMAEASRPLAGNE